MGCILASGLFFPLQFFLPGLWSRVVKRLGYSRGLCWLFFSSAQPLIFLQFKDQLSLFLKLLPLLLNQTLLEGMTVLKMATISRSCLWTRCLKLLGERDYLILVHNLILGTQGCMFYSNLPGKFEFSVWMRCVSSIPTRVVSGLVRFFPYKASFGWLGKKKKKKKNLALIKTKHSSALST